MSSKKEFKFVVELFEHYYIAVTNNKYFSLSISKNRSVLIKKFIEKFKEITKSNFLQDEYLQKYFQFQFNHWYKRDAKYGAGTSIQLEWIVGNKAIKRWEEADKKWLEWIIQTNLKKDTKVSNFVSSNDYTELLVELNVVDENEKERFFNTVKGYWNCLLYTTLYNHKSNWCMQCKKSMDCKRNLKKKFPSIYKKRGY